MVVTYDHDTVSVEFLLCIGQRQYYGTQDPPQGARTHFARKIIAENGIQHMQRDPFPVPLPIPINITPQRGTPELSQPKVDYEGMVIITFWFNQHSTRLTIGRT